MSASLIINARDSLRWHQRLFSDASTVLMWGAWMKLWLPVLSSLAWALGYGALSRIAPAKLLSVGSAQEIQRYALTLVGASGTLLLWNRLPSLKVRTAEVQSLSDYARHFELPEAEIVDGRATSVCVVHHDEVGRIVRVERRAA